VINLLWIFLFIGVGLIIEKIVKVKVLQQYFQIDHESLKGMRQGNRFISSIVNALPEFIGLFLFFGAAYVSFVLFEPSNSSLVQLTFFACLLTISLVRTVSIVSNILLSPAVEEFRFAPFDSNAAKKIHRGIIFLFAYIVAVLIFAAVAHKLGAQQTTVLLLQLFFASVLLFITATGVYLYKNRIKAYIICGEKDAGETSWGMSQFASVWHILAFLYLGLIWLLLINSIASPQQGSKGAFLLSFFVVPIWLLADQLVQWVVRYAMSTLKIHEKQYDDKEEVEEEVLAARERGLLLYIKTISISRIALIGAIAIWVAGLWKIQIPFISALAAVILDALIIMTLALVFWKFISNWIEEKIQETIGDEEEENSDDEWGGTARGRSYTLLPMIRKSIASVLVIMVTLTVLSSMGVDIGPLLAGAGVVGLAVGFGAQKLVSDMFSGFFYLLDDAFRVGEYLTAGSVSGTVESITLRNIMLRHHRGMLQIVPHSDLGAITNFMRGGMIVKFNLDFPYDTDIDKVRKIIKKVGIAMLDDEEIGKDFIQPVKSQGVREITNSVMTIRVKFTAQPGTHFVIRREAYKRVTEALKAAGIEYAHKKVIVDVPGLEESVKSGKISSEAAIQIANSAGAAALSSLAEEPVPPEKTA
jgi:small-conductance mechanosensitive channel